MGATVDTLTVTGASVFSGAVSLPSSAALYTNGIPQAALAENTTQRFGIPIVPGLWTKHDEAYTPLTNPSANDDLGIYGVFGTTSPYLGTYDIGGGVSLPFYARTVWQLPQNYVAAGALSIAVNAGMLTTVCSVSCTVDAVVQKLDLDTTVAADIVSGSAVSMNSLTFGEKTIAINPATLSAGDWLDIRLLIQVNDAGDAGVMYAAIASVDMLATTYG